MSNPAVITLAQAEIGRENFRIEDNIGEGIHVHIGNTRIEMSIRNFLEITELLKKIVENMVEVKEFSFKRFDAIWLFDNPALLLEVANIKFERRQLGVLLTNQYDENGEQHLVPISNGRVLKARQGDREELINWNQINYIFDDNMKRLNDVFRIINDEGYRPEIGSYVSVCDDGFFVADGCHRVSALIEKEGISGEIIVANWITKHGKWSDARKIYTQTAEYESKRIAIRCENNRRIFRDINIKYLISKDLQGKRIIIRGAGLHTKKFIERYGEQVNIVGIMAREILDDELKSYPIIDESTINEIDADMIFISSYYHRYDMKLDCRKYSDRFEIYDLYDRGIDKEFFS